MACDDNELSVAALKAEQRRQEIVNDWRSQKWWGTLLIIAFSIGAYTCNTGLKKEMLEQHYNHCIQGAKP